MARRFASARVSVAVGRDDARASCSPAAERALGDDRGRVGGQRRGEAEAAELAVRLEGRGAKMRRGAERDAPDGIDGDEGGDAARRRRASPPPCRSRPSGRRSWRPCRRRREPIAGVRRRRLAGGAAERRIEQRAPIARRALSPPLARSKSARRRHDRHADVADREAAPAPGEPAHHAVGRREAEGRAAGKHDRVDALDEVARARAGRSRGSPARRPPRAPPRSPARRAGRR